MTASGAQRREVDIERVRALAAASQGRVVIQTLPAPGEPWFLLELRYATAGSSRYPAERQPHSLLRIELSARHPFMPPTASVLTPIHHPNVFPSGVVCLGTRWMPSEGMDLFVQRVLRLLAFDPLLVNPRSVAHSAALHWYRSALRAHPQHFPTDAAALTLGAEPPLPPAPTSISPPTPTPTPNPTPTPAPAQPDRVVRACPGCGAGLRLPAGRAGGVACPRCAAEFEVQT